MNKNSQPASHVLIVEDDQSIAQLLQDYLQFEGLQASVQSDGEQALAQIKRQTPDLILLDVMLPGLDGVQICRAVREFSDVPIMMITARVEEIDKLLGLNTGADDYVCKPFSPREVMARVHALLRRSQSRVSAQSRPWEIVEEQLRINWRGHNLLLTALEFRLFRILLAHPGRVYSRTQLLENLYQEFRDVSERAIDTHIKNIRRKIQTVEPENNSLVAVYGMGYRVDIPDKTASTN